MSKESSYTPHTKEKEVTNNELQQRILQEIYVLEKWILWLFVIACSLFIMILCENKYIFKMLETIQQQQEQTINK